MKLSISAKLALTSVACVFAVMAVFAYFSYAFEKQRLETLTDESSQHIFEHAVSSVKLPVFQYDYQQTDAVLSAEVREGDVVAVVVRDMGGDVYAGKRRDEHNEVVDLAASGIDAALREGCYRHLTGPIRTDGSVRNPVIGSLELCLTDASLRTTLSAMLARMVMYTVLVSLFLSVVVFLSLRHLLLKPIMVIRDTVTRFEQMDFSSRCLLQSSDELGLLARSFNQMASTIQDYSENMEQTIADRTLELTRKNEIILLEKEFAEAATRAKTQLLAEQEALIKQLEDAQGQLLQSEKMASVGQLAAGVAHEINNPIGFINSNLNSLKGNVENLLAVIAVYEKADAALSGHLDLLNAITKAKSEADLDFLQNDIQNLIDESLEGVQRVKKIVDNLKNFSRVDSGEWQYANLESGLESTLNIVWNELKYKAEVKKEYAGLPEIECIPSQLNQVFMNLMVNAAHAIAERGIITLRTGFDEHSVWVEVEDTGSGIQPEHIKRIFDPFFTTKPVGKGTGLGLSLAYGIVQRHQGKLDVQSEPGKGTVFRLTLPRVRVVNEGGA